MYDFNERNKKKVSFFFSNENYAGVRFLMMDRLRFWQKKKKTHWISPQQNWPFILCTKCSKKYISKIHDLDYWFLFGEFVETILVSMHSSKSFTTKRKLFHFISLWKVLHLQHIKSIHFYRFSRERGTGMDESHFDWNTLSHGFIKTATASNFNILNWIMEFLFLLLLIFSVARRRRNHHNFTFIHRVRINSIHTRIRIIVYWSVYKYVCIVLAF